MRTSTGILGSSLARGDRLEIGQHGLDGGEARAHAHRLGQPIFQGFDGLETASCDADDDRLVAADAAFRDELPGGGQGHAPAVSAKIPSVRARSSIVSTISSSVACAAQPPDSRTAWAA